MLPSACEMGKRSTQTPAHLRAEVKQREKITHISIVFIKLITHLAWRPLSELWTVSQRLVCLRAWLPPFRWLFTVILIAQA